MQTPLLDDNQSIAGHRGTDHQHNKGAKMQSAGATPAASAGDPCHTALLSWLSSECRAFPVSSADVRVLSSPAEFYSTLLDLAGKAERRVVLSSLYLGTGPHEQALVAALQQRMQQRPELKVDVMLDYLRGTRLVGEEQLSSVTAVAPLMQQANAAANSSTAASSGSQFQLHLLQLPPPAVPAQISAMRAWVERNLFTGNKTREAVAVHHMKFYVFDQHTIISGSENKRTELTKCPSRSCSLIATYNAVSVVPERI
jgi:phosphatidylserine/phosphatidylglycerophosphate/cardiolipin synthase-like enzyme